MTSPYRIDVHHHVVPPFWTTAVEAAGGDPSGFPAPTWSVDQDLRFMDGLAIRKAILSLTTPAVSLWQGREQADMARRVNEFVAEVVHARPDRFGNFATLPMDDTDAALAEIRHCAQALRVEGFVLLSNYGAQYLGEARFDPVWQALDDIGAVVLVHPTTPRIAQLPGIMAPMLDFPFDTTRSAVSLLAGGHLLRFPRVKIILSHAGGFLPYVAYRCAGPLATRQGVGVDDLVGQMKRFYFDTALSGAQATLNALMSFAEPGRVLFGSDYPYASAPRATWFTQSLDGFGLAERDHDAVVAGNAADLGLA